MKLYDVALAARPLQKLIEQDLPLRQAYKLAILATKINPTLEFYGKQLMNGKAQEELNELQADIEGIERVTLPLNLNIKLSAGDIKCLEPFVTFDEGETT